MTALAIHPSPSARRVRQHAPGLPCTHARSGRAGRHLSVVPAPVERGEQDAATPDVAAVRAQAAGRAQTAAPAEVARLRLTTRGRRALTTLGFALAIALGSGLGAVAYSPDAVPSDVDTVVVQPGQSLWVIADGLASPGQDVREVIEQIRALNALEYSTVHAGQELAVPAS